MPLTPPRWHNVTESQFPWERDALEFLALALDRLTCDRAAKQFTCRSDKADGHKASTQVVNASRCTRPAATTDCCPFTPPAYGVRDRVLVDVEAEVDDRARHALIVGGSGNSRGADPREGRRPAQSNPQGGD
jgi:hypothetical protein